MVGWIANRSRVVIKRYLNEDTYKLIRYGYFSVYKREGTTCAEELDDIKMAISKGIQGAVIEDEKYLLRAGHGGTLDSMATGVLVVALCDGCKVLPLMLQSNKRYTVTARLGIATDSYNKSGNVVAESDYGHVTKSLLEKNLKEFIGEIWQKPPVYSALKIHGRRAADIAREGGEVNLIPRPVHCYAAHCLEFEPPFFTLDVSCGHGFYIRSLVHDLARDCNVAKRTGSMLCFEAIVVVMEEDAPAADDGPDDSLRTFNLSPLESGTGSSLEPDRNFTGERNIK